MFDAYRDRGVIRNSTKSDWWTRYANPELTTNICPSSEDDERRSRNQKTPHGETPRFAVTPITWKQRSSTKVLSAFLILRLTLEQLRSCAQRRFGGVVIGR